jgi:hypothetical protein
MASAQIPFVERAQPLRGLNLFRYLDGGRLDDSVGCAGWWQAGRI